MDFLDRYVIRISWWSLKKIYRISIPTTLGSFFIGLISFYVYMTSQSALYTWHTTLEQKH